MRHVTTQHRGRVRYNSGELRDELLNREVFYTVEGAKLLIENWRREYNTIRPHSSRDYWPPAREALVEAG